MKKRKMKNNIKIIFSSIILGVFCNCTFEKSVSHDEHKDTAISIAADSLYGLISSIYDVTLKKSVSIEEIKKMLIFDGIIKLPLKNVKFYSVKWNSEPITEKIVFISNKCQGTLNIKNNLMTGLDSNFVNQISNFLFYEPSLKMKDFELLTKSIIELTDLYIIDSTSDINDPIETYNDFINIVKKRKIFKENDTLTGEYYCVNNYSGYLYEIIFKYEKHKLQMNSKSFGRVAEKKINL